MSKIISIAKFYILIMTIFSNLGLYASDTERDIEKSLKSLKSIKIEEVEEEESEQEELEDEQEALQNMPFKLGFEFQKSSGLCKWASSILEIQKKPLFTLKHTLSKKQLWHVVIDTDDIEFVTEPFSHKQKIYLEYSAKSIVHAIGILQNLLKHNEDLCFNHWVDLMKKETKKIFFLFRNFT
jgi:hypothetical protein